VGHVKVDRPAAGVSLEYLTYVAIFYVPFAVLRLLAFISHVVAVYSCCWRFVAVALSIHGVPAFFTFQNCDKN
jgi:hypothetical protein